MPIEENTATSDRGEESASPLPVATSGTAPLERARALAAEGKLEESVTQLRKALEKSASDATLHFELAVTLHRLGRLRQAVEEYRITSELTPKNSQLFNDLGVALQQLGELTESAEAFQKAITLAPGSFYAYMNLGLTLGRKGETKEAIKAYRKVLELNPDFGPAYLNMGNILKMRGEFLGAERLLRKAIELNPDLPEAHFSLSIILSDLGELEEAMLLAKRALELRKDYTRAQEHIDCLARIEATPNESETSEQLPGRKAAVEYWRALRHELSGNAEEALSGFFKAVKLDSFHRRALNEAALLLSKSDSPEVQGEMRSRLSQEQPPTDFSTAFGWVETNRQAKIPGLLADSPPKRTRTRWFDDMPAREYIYCPFGEFIFAPIPKAACTSLFVVIYSILRRNVPSLPEIDARKEARTLHMYLRNTFSLSRYPEEFAKKLLERASVYKFSFVRNPFDRIASAYLDKFVRYRHDPRQWDHTMTVLLPVLGKDANPENHGLTFRQFVEYLEETGEHKLDRHWVPQSELIEHDRLDFIGKLENLHNDYSVVRARLRLTDSIPHEHNSLRNLDETDTQSRCFADLTPDQLLQLQKLPSTREMYDTRLESTIAKRYADDFSNFRYSNTILT